MIWHNLDFILSQKYVSSTVVDEIKTITAYVCVKELEIDQTVGQEESKENEPDNINDNKRLFNATIYSQSPFYIEFKEISDKIIVTEESSQRGLNYFYNVGFLTLFLKKYVTYLPLWSGVFHLKRCSNSLVESHFFLIKKRCKESFTLGKLPTKCLRFIKEVRKWNVATFKRFMLSFPKKSIKKSSKPIIPSDEAEKSFFSVWSQ